VSEYRLYCITFAKFVTRSKCLKHVPGKKSAIGDKPAIRRQGVIVGFDTERMPFIRGVGVVEEYNIQQAAVGLLRILSNNQLI
jgi:hypothetical protein